MCGRFTLALSPEQLARWYDLAEEPPAAPPRYNVAPSQLVAVVGLKPDGVRRGLVRMRWGFVPRWAADPNAGPKPINAKAETLATNAAFRQSFRDRRCLIPCDGFYEWAKTPDGAKRAYHFRPRVQPVAFAGVWDVWHPPGGGEPLFTCAIITVAANAVVAPLHARMPAILTADHFAAWLDPRTPTADLLALLAPFPDDALEAVPVGPAVNSPKNDGPECLAEAA